METRALKRILLTKKSELSSLISLKIFVQQEKDETFFGFLIFFENLLGQPMDFYQREQRDIQRKKVQFELYKLNKIRLKGFQKQNQFLNYLTMATNLKYLCLLIITLCAINSQVLQYDGYIETRKLFLFGPDNGFEYTELNKTHAFLFERAFDNVPRVGLAVYTLDFQYSPDFSCQITAATNKTATAVKVTSSNQNTNNRLYIMYIATDNQQVGIFVPERLYTNDLSLPNRNKNVQNFDYNFKEEISKLASKYTDISVSVYLTGLSTTSEMTTNGFPTNRTSVSLREYHTSTKFYTIEVSIGEDYPYVLIDWVQCTVVYFIPDVLSNNRYQMNSGMVTLKAYGGTVMPVSQSIDFLPLTASNKFENLKFFFGINRIECKDGQSITLLGVQKYYTSPTDNSVRLLLQMETWKLTLMAASAFNYIQYKSLKCTEPGANCNSTCSTDLRPYYTVLGQCNYCHYSCLTCNVTNSDSYCDTCHATRVLNNSTHLCDCTAQFYQTRDNYSCTDCFPCATCQKASTCLTCLSTQNMILNSVTSECLCKAGFYGNMVAVSANTSTYLKTQPCLKCSENCLYCVNATLCKACSMNTYLSGGICIPICAQNEKFNQQTNSCQFYEGDLYDQDGRLDFDWSYKSVDNEMIIDLIFSQANMSYYYYENGKGYTYEEYRKQLQNGGDDVAGGSGSSFYYDDGINMAGYTLADQTITISDSSSSGSSSSDSSSSSSGSLSQASSSAIDDSALKGQYYGYGQKRFFQLLYENYSASYKDDYGIPFGKYQLSSVSETSTANYLEAFSRNLVFKIGGEVIPYTMEGLSGNHFILRTRPTKTYINSLGSIQIKNKALVRSGKTALQKNNVTKEISRFDYYTQQQLSSAYSLKSSNSVLVDILWGICKYPLFIGFGWPFLPIMMALQYIMSFNYIHSNLPLNLDYFLASFRDFRNPSILYNPLRNEFDAKVVNHQNIYKSYSEFEEFDRGIDFMKNCWEFFFIPILACALLLLLFLLNLIFRKCCRRDFCIISKFLLPRAPLLIAAYTLVQALPVSFFFFAQLKDTTFRHPLQPNRVYPTFNTAMAYLVFFLTCAIPILLLAWLYYHFNYGSRISQFSDANVFHRKFLNKIDDASGKFSRAQLRDPLWGGDSSKYGTFIFGAAVFGLAIVFGFFIAFFINDFAWQLAGILLFTVLFLAFTVAASFFVNKVIKVFFIIFMILMLAYLLLHAGIGSNRSIGTYDQWNTGYLGVGILYALLITAILFTAYLLYRFFKEAYENHKKYGCWIDVDKKNDLPEEKKQVQRVTEYRRDTKLKSTFLKNGVSSIGGNNLNGLMGSQFKDNIMMTSNVKRMAPEDEILPSEQRMLTHTYARPQVNTYEQLVLSKQDSYKKQTIFISKDRNIIFAFPEENGQILLSKQPIYIDAENRLYDRNKDFIDYYANLIKRPQINARNPLPPTRTVHTTYQTITSKKEIYVISGEEFEKIGVQSDGNLRLKSMSTGEIRIFNVNDFKKTSSSILQYNSNSNLQIEERSKLSYPNKHIVYNGEEYLDLGYDSYSRDFKFLNSKTNVIQRVSKPRYIKMMEENFTKRIYIGSQEYDYEGTDQYGKVYLINTTTKQQLVIPQSEFQKHRESCVKAFHQNLNKELGSSDQKTQVIMYQGEQYEHLGLDEQGRHRLFSNKLKKHILISENEFKTLYGNIRGSASQNLLLLQSSVGAMHKAPIQRQQQQQINFRHDSETSKFFIFEDQNGQKIYIPKSKINADLPIELDEEGNLSQNGKIIINLQDARSGGFDSQRKTQTLIGQGRNGAQIEKVQPQIAESQAFEELQEDDAINPDEYYKIMGIPEEKVNQFQFKPKDVYLTERNIRGREVMQKIEKIQQKYPNLLLLVRNQSNEAEQFWIR